MCGIVGFISGAGKSGYPADRTKFIRQGLVVDSLRGMDSTGIFTVREGNEDKTAAYLKQAVPGGQFVCTKKFGEYIKDPDSFRAIIGHNRAATQGSVKTDNAHPFQEDNITLVHNGTLSSSYSMPLPERKMKDKGVEVDSHVICHNIASEPIDKWYRHMHGSWALVWHDADDGSINIIRNESRPLHFAKVEREDTLIICSEADMLTFLARRCTIKVENLFTIKPHHLFKWLPDTPVMEPVVRELDRSYNYSQAYSGGRRSAVDVDDDGGYGALWWDSNWGSRRSATNPAPFAEQANHVHLCGRMREIPEALQEELAELDLDVSDRLEFQPWSKIGEDVNGFSTVAGFLRKAELPAIVHGAPSYIGSGDLPKSREWLVRPMAVYDPDHPPESPEGLGPYVVCKYVQSYVPPVSAPGPSRFNALGPNDERISLEAFHVLTKHGCHSCRRDISWLDDEDISWNSDKKPICSVCTSLTRRVS